MYYSLSLILSFAIDPHYEFINHYDDLSNVIENADDDDDHLADVDSLANDHNDDIYLFFDARLNLNVISIDAEHDSPENQLGNLYHCSEVGLFSANTPSIIKLLSNFIIETCIFKVK